MLVLQWESLFASNGSKENERRLTKNGGERGTDDQNSDESQFSFDTNHTAQIPITVVINSVALGSISMLIGSQSLRQLHRFGNEQARMLR